MGHKLALDFGTTNSVIARWDESAACGQVLDLAPLGAPAGSGAFLIPSLLYVRDGQKEEVVIGQAVRQQGLDRQPGNRLFRNIKRSISIEPVYEARLIDGAPWTEELAGRIFLRRLLESLPYRTEAIDQLVVTAPVAALDGYVDWIRRAVEGLAIGKIRLVDEATAVALGYAITEPGATVLVIDFGGGTLDLSLVRLPDTRVGTAPGGRRARVIAKTGVSLGGSDIDQWLLQEILRREQLSIESLGLDYPVLLSACESAKIALSTSRETSLQLTTEAGRRISVSLARPELEALMGQNGFFTTLDRALEKVTGLASKQGVYREDIRYVLLVGGTSLIPSVQQTLDAYFRSMTQRRRKSITQMPKWPATTWTVENTSIRADKPFTAVVEGALRVSTGLGLDDQLSHGYGLRHLAADGVRRFDEIIPMGDRIPSRKPVRVVLSASRQNQAELEIVVGQIDTGAVSAVEFKFEGGQTAFVAQDGVNPSQVIPLNAGEPLRVTLSPPGQPGQERLRAEFRVDAMRCLRVSVIDLKTRRRLLKDAILAGLGSRGAVASQEGCAQERSSGSEPSLIRREPAGDRLSTNNLIAVFRRLLSGQGPGGASLAALRSSDSLVRFNSAETLARRGDREARLAFEKILQTGLPHQRASVARHFHHFSWFTAESLCRRALGDEDARVREAAIFALCRMHLPEAYALVIDVLQNCSDAMRLSAVWGLYDHPQPAAIPVLALALQAQDPEIRTLALEVLGATEAPEAIDVVKSAMRDPNPEVRYAATLSWVELARADCLMELADRIEQTQGKERFWILRGLFHATNYLGIDVGSQPGAPRLIQALETALGDGLPEARLAAFYPLAWMRHPSADTALLAGFHRERDCDVKVHMLASAVHLMSPVAKVLVEEALRSGDHSLIRAAEYLRS